MSHRIIAGFSEIVAAYDAALVDLWGCVHDGIRPYPGVLDCLRRMREAGVRVLFLTNASRLHGAVRRQLDGFGVPEDCADGIISAGDTTVRALNRREDPWHAALGRRFFHLGPERSAGMIAEIEGEAVDFDAADYILNTGLFDDDRETVADYRGMLEEARDRGLRMVCANPDRVVMRGKRTIFCAGALADAYEQIGGEVRRHGKPHAGIYQMAFAWLGSVSRDRVVMVGDSFSTDIAGAAGVGIDSLWLAGGIHAAEVGFSETAPLDAAKVAQAIGTADAHPTLVAPRLVW